MGAPAAQVAQVHPRIASLVGIVLVVAFLAAWRMRERKGATTSA